MSQARMPPPNPEQLPRVRTISVPRLRKHLGRQKGECTWCGSKLTGRKYHWCGEQCVNEYRSHYAPGYIRHLVEQRDKGICAKCGNDCKHWRGVLQKANDYWWLSRQNRDHNERWVDGKRVINRRGRRNLRKMERLSRHLKTLADAAAWEADHIIPVIHGGSVLGIENIRTLCLRCHKLETKGLAGRRAEERKQRRKHGKAL